MVATPLVGELDDAVQDVLMECLRPDDALSRAESGRGDLRALLFGVSRNVALRFDERARQRAKRRGDTAAIDGIEATEPTLSVVFDRECARTMVSLAGDRMRAAAEHGSAGARLRVELMRLRFVDGLPIREIAAQWDVEPEAVHRAYAKARAEFRVCLRQVLEQHAVRSEGSLDLEMERMLAMLG